MEADPGIVPVRESGELCQFRGRFHGQGFLPDVAAGAVLFQTEEDLVFAGGRAGGDAEGRFPLFSATGDPVDGQRKIGLHGKTGRGGGEGVRKAD